MKICVILRTRAARSARPSHQLKNRLGLVPTMGALHEGHLSLVRAAKAQCEAVAVSIFVNPTQFGPRRLSKYPRSSRGLPRSKKEGVEILFAPSSRRCIPRSTTSWVTVEGLSDKSDGRSRPGHFRGVTTVVSKLFHILEPRCGVLRPKRMRLSSQ